MKNLLAIGSLLLALQTVHAQSFRATLTGAAERPTPNNATATGTGNFTITGTTFSWNITYTGLTGNPTASHIHGPGSVDQSVGVMIPFTVTGLGTSGTISGSSTITQSQIDTILGGLSYANIHTAAFPGGEIRGQLVAVPEPSVLGLMALGGIGLAVAAKRRRR